jgi:hypothetical protein
MKEAHMVEAVQEALGRLGIDDEVVAAGMFFPRGHTGAMFAGGWSAAGSVTRWVGRPGTWGWWRAR